MATSIEYDIGTLWRKSRHWRARPLCDADRPGLAQLAERGLLHSLVGGSFVDRPSNERDFARVIEASDQIVGAVICDRVSGSTRPTPHPWTQTEAAAVDDVSSKGSLALEWASWRALEDIRPDVILRDIVCNAVQRRGLLEARARVPFEPGARHARGWLQWLHADYGSSRVDDHAVAWFLRAGFRLHGYHVDDRGRHVAHLQWPNRAR